MVSYRTYCSPTCPFHMTLCLRELSILANTDQFLTAPKYSIKWMNHNSFNHFPTTKHFNLLLTFCYIDNASVNIFGHASFYMYTNKE